MNFRTIVSCFAAAVTTSVIILSCGGSPSGTDEPVVKQTLTSEETTDLQKMANTITEIVSFDDVYSSEDVMAKKRSDITIDDCEQISDALTVCSYSYDGMSSIDSTWYWADAAKTVPADMQSTDPGNYIYSVVHSISTDDETISDMYIDMSMKIPDFSSMFTSETDIENIDYDAMYRSMEMSAKMHGSLNYVNDDLLLEFKKVTFTLKNGTLSVNYLFEIMEGKYTVTMSYSMDFVKLMQEDLTEEQSDQMFKGSITNSSAEQVGIFVVYSDGSVEIFDNDGNSMKTAG